MKSGSCAVRQSPEKTNLGPEEKSASWTVCKSFAKFCYPRILFKFRQILLNSDNSYSFTNRENVILQRDNTRSCIHLFSRCYYLFRLSLISIDGKFFIWQKIFSTKKLKKICSNCIISLLKKRTSIFQILPQITIVESGTNFCQILFFNVESSTKIQ